MKISEETNLPELPEGYRWRMAEGYAANYLQLRLEKYNTSFFGFFKWWSKVDYELLSLEYMHSSHSGAVKMAEDMYYRAFTDPNWKERYIGVYPPKKFDS